MQSGKHILISAVAGIALFYLLGMPIFSKELAIIVVFGFLIDLDHLFNQMWKGNLRNPPIMIREWEATAEAHTGELYVFHSYEFIAIIGVTSIFFPIMRFALVGLVLHFFCDAIVNYKSTRTFEWVEDYSAIYTFYTMRHYNVEKRLFRSFKKMIHPKTIPHIVMIYLIYVYTHPNQFLKWFLFK
jgi:hypothetical protein